MPIRPRRGSRTLAVEIVAYDPSWPARFEAERRRLLGLFAPDPVRIEHVGSTAVPGLAAKPIVDMLLGVPAKSAFIRSVLDDGLR